MRIVDQKHEHTYLWKWLIYSDMDTLEHTPSRFNTDTYRNPKSSSYRISAHAQFRTACPENSIGAGVIAIHRQTHRTFSDSASNTRRNDWMFTCTANCAAAMVSGLPGCWTTDDIDGMWMWVYDIQSRTCTVLARTRPGVHVCRDMPAEYAFNWPGRLGRIDFGLLCVVVPHIKPLLCCAVYACSFVSVCVM